MGLFDRFRRDDAGTPPPGDEVGVGTFAGLRALVRGGAGLGEQQESILSVLRAHGVPAGPIDRLVGSMRDGIALFESGHGAAPAQAGVDPLADQAPCRLGGPPVLPAGEAWPVDHDGRPLSFIAALDLDRVPRLPPLPAAGTLLVYWDHAFAELDAMDFVDATRVWLVPPGAPLAAARAPEGTQAFGPIVLDPVAMPFPGEPDALQDVPEGVPGYELQDALMQELPHSLLGASRDVQGPVLEEIPYWFSHVFPATAERYSAAERAGEGWALLAQFDGTDGLEFGDAGSLYLVIPAADLAQGRTDRVMGIMQCL